MKSMTGYGAAQVESRGFSFECNIRAVNGRFLELKLHGSKEVYALESEIRQILTGFVSRGTVDIFFAKRSLANNSRAQAVSIDESLLKFYLEKTLSISKNLKLKEKPSLLSLMRLPEVIKVQDRAEFDDEDKKALLQSLKLAAEKLVQERLREGLSLRADAVKNIGLLKAHHQEIEKARKQVNDSMLTKMREKILSRMSGIEVDPQRIAQEVAMMAEKADIDEELSRLTEHFKNYETLIMAEGPLGKKLDFYTQELLREVNTIGSKSQVLEVTSRVVECKTLIERLREQVQNIE